MGTLERENMNPKKVSPETFKAAREILDTASERYWGVYEHRRQAARAVRLLTRMCPEYEFEIDRKPAAVVMMWRIYKE